MENITEEYQLNHKLNQLKKIIEEHEKIISTSEENLPQEYKRLQDELDIRDKQIETLKNALDKKEENTLINEENIKYIEDLKIIGVEKDIQIAFLKENIQKLQKSESGIFYLTRP
jgi:alanyl-tRNA synthetase